MVKKKGKDGEKVDGNVEGECGWKCRWKKGMKRYAKHGCKGRVKCGWKVKEKADGMIGDR